ncbi:hypothetical protein HU200_005054 [Digitaria exilis]|uniref:F-box domain-containing protein n=1 Tax=Digitaria exilis TaxID=1010633 RepID=A0A835FTR1_9POAL|nr:hypothetical protein HU200_005054 [Digitaria exilis]
MEPSFDHRPHKKPGPSAPTSRDWTTLPHDILFAVCLKLELREILRGADRVCKSWRHVTVGEPALWRHLDMGTMDLSQCRDLVSRGGVTCESFTARCESDVSLRFLVARVKLSPTILHEKIGQAPGIRHASFFPIDHLFGRHHLLMPPLASSIGTTRTHPSLRSACSQLAFTKRSSQHIATI